VVGARAPRSVRAGSTIPVRVSLRRRGTGASRSLPVEVPVPRDVRPGSRTLTIAGNGGGGRGDEILLEVFGELLGLDEIGAPGSEPRTVEQLVRRVEALHQPLGIEARWRRRDPRVVLESKEVRYEGRARVKLQVIPARR
jgi:hypothetical protein